MMEQLEPRWETTHLHDAFMDPRKKAFLQVQSQNSEMVFAQLIFRQIIFVGVYF